MKIEIRKNTSGLGNPIYQVVYGSDVLVIAASDLPSLSEAAFSALCDMNTERMADQPNSCYCDTARWKRLGSKPPCASFTRDYHEQSDELMCNCGHWQICHVHPIGKQP